MHVVGNIPYDSTDLELRDTVSLAGPFREFKLKTDSKTQGHKGFGFCEY
jgi:RNA recognition motif-containing protein